ncbi:MAG: histidinol-phosphate transaminase [Gammaproteobacteria bacterium]|nr:histidinol-phosphate transaminase [Gammaproteobacteria bacterium]MDP2140090.1 histidinol-phosphate transaminase [Gammaproteobacteria bacterium]MDP2347652.1 histidinol-phosphate transaminase [Gammaproteobacteria bacterium]
MSYERPNIQRMTGYASGEQPNQPGIIKLNTNENPYPATPAVAAALAELRVEVLRRYPQPLANDFRRVAAQYHDVTIDNIIATNGGDELLRLVITTFVDVGDTIAIAEPSYSLYPVLAEIQGCEVARIALQDDWTMAEDFAAQLNASGAKLAFIVNPHAPSGVLTPAARLAAIAEEFDGVLVIDEAYVDFIDPEQHYDAAALTKRFDNVVILRTMSKGYSLAGLRFAYGIAATSLTEPMLYKTRDSYNTDVISQVLATAALSDHATAAQGWEKVRSERVRVKTALTALGFSCADSQSNFLLAQVPSADMRYESSELMAREFYQRLKDDGILIRYFDQPRLRDKLRITIGTFDENQKLLQHLETYLGKT